MRTIKEVVEQIKKDFPNISFNDNPLEKYLDEILEIDKTKMDKIIEPLEAELRLANKEVKRCMMKNPLQFDYAHGYKNGISNTIEMIKGGGVDEKNIL